MTPPPSHAGSRAFPASATHGRSGTEPLAHEALERARRASDRIASQLRAVIGSLPAAARNASGMARYLDIDRTTCQRAVWASTHAEMGAELLARLPGTKALRDLAKSARKKGVLEETVAGLEAAVLHVDELIKEIAGSQSRLSQRLAAGAAPALDGSASLDSAEAARRQLFEAATVLTGRWSRVNLSLFAFKPADSDPRMMSRAVLNGFLGHEARADAVPLVLNTGRRALNVDPETVDLRTLEKAAVQGRSPGIVLTEFSSKPPPVVTSRGPGGDLIQVIDADRASETAVDVIVANYGEAVGPHPATETPAVQEAWHLIHYPAQHLVFDVYLHRDMARMCIPSADAHLWRPYFDKSIGDRWDTRLPDGPRLEVLGPGIRKSACAEHPRHAEMTAYLFDRVGFKPDEFIGFRCIVDNPVWRAGYCMSFDFTGSELR